MRLLAITMLCVMGLSASTPQIRASADALPHDAYIWQRAWTPQLVSAAHRSSDLVRAWRILLAELDRYGHWTTIAIPWNDVLSTKQPIVVVIRIDGRLNEERFSTILDRILDVGPCDCAYHRIR